jgi:hypothetical protein
MLTAMQLSTGLSKRLLVNAIEAGAIKNPPLNVKKKSELDLDNSELWYTANMRQRPRKMNTPKPKKPLEVIGLDIMAKFRVKSRNGNHYCFLFVDYGTRMIWHYFGRKKSSLAAAMRLFAAEVPDGTGHAVRCIQSDSEQVIMKGKVKEVLDELNITTRYSAPYAHHENGLVERSIGMVQNLARFIILKDNVPEFYYEDAIVSACGVLNKFRLVPKGVKSPYEMFYNERPCFRNYVPFYARGLAYIYPDERKGKTAARARVVRYINVAKGYKNAFVVLDVSPRDQRLLIRKDVRWLHDVSRDDDESARRAIVHNEFPAETVMKALDRDNPKTITEALSSPDRSKWMEALRKEIVACIDRGTFIAVPKKGPPGKRVGGVMTSKMLFDVKADGRSKCRLVAPGFSQRKLRSQL